MPSTSRQTAGASTKKGKGAKKQETGSNLTARENMTIDNSVNAVRAWTSTVERENMEGDGGGIVTSQVRLDCSEKILNMYQYNTK